MKFLKKYKFLVFLTLVVAIVALVVLVLNPLFNTNKYPIAYLTINNDPDKIIAVYFEAESINEGQRINPATGGTEYSTSSKEINGYLIELVNPKDGKVLNSIRIERKPDEIANSKVFITEENKIFIVFIPSSISKAEAFIEVFNLKENKLSLDKSPQLSGLKFIDYNETNAKLTNEFNEVYILDFQTGNLNPESIAEIKKLESKGPLTSQFFFVNYLPNSTRHIPYFLKFKKDNNYYSGTAGDMLNMQIRSPLDPKLDYNPSSLTKVSNPAAMKMYSTKIKKPEILNELKLNNEQCILNRPNIVYLSDSTCLLIAEEDEENQMFYFLSHEAVMWTVKVPKTEEKLKSVNLVNSENDFIISSDKNWIMRLSNDGKIKWKYPKD